jgi:molybdenum cofactor cytidylyltransferase
LISTTDITPVILAAGDSTRMGYPKALLPLGSDTFLSRILKTAKSADLGKPIVVLGKSGSKIQSTMKSRQVEIVLNPDPGRGQLSSVQLAFSSLGSACIGAMLWPVDHPLVSVKLVAGLARLFLTTDALITNPTCGNKRGHPVIFRRDLFPEFLKAPLTEGPKGIVIRHKESTAELQTEETGTVFDIDTPMDYEAACGRDLSSALKSLVSSGKIRQ